MPNQPNIPADLRRRAELRLNDQQSKTAPNQTEVDNQRLLHELQVHQIELELQNEELQRANAESAALLLQYTALYDFAPTGYFTLDRDEAILSVNLVGASLLGINRSKLVNRHFGPFVATERRRDFTAFLGNAFESGVNEVCETSLQRKANPPQWVWIEARATASGQECHLSVMDITGRKQEEADRARLERLVHAASEREQRRIGEMLNEDFCQRLAGIEAATLAMAKVLTAKARPASRLAREIAGQIHETLRQARHFANVLQPVSLLEQGLVAAIDHLVLHVQERPGIRCRFKWEALPEIAVSDAMQLYRIAQEAINNAVQHANASRIDIGISMRGDACVMTVADNGLGTAEPNGNEAGMGLLIMRYRSQQLGAPLTIQSKPGHGTVVTCCYSVTRSGS